MESVELDDLADAEDIAAGRIVDIEHARLMKPLTEACADLENELDEFYTTSVRDAVINKMSVEELQALISSMKSMTDSIRAIKKSATD
ncbi:hypothetical protein [Fibrobacter sp.]|uniref:hypothetical protein n=1 Tax=Fibrobacter sp. TaxID=35828 RepID=UPI003890E677